MAIGQLIITNSRNRLEFCTTNFALIYDYHQAQQNHVNPQEHMTGLNTSCKLIGFLLASDLTVHWVVDGLSASWWPECPNY